MKITSRQCGVAVVLAGAMALAGAAPALAAPVFSSTSGMKAAVSDQVVDVQYRRWHRGGRGFGIGAGVAAGALLGAGIAAATAPRYYYGPQYGAYAYEEAPVVYGAPAYGYGAYAPAYGYGSSYAYPYQSCGVSAGYGRWDYSQC